MNASSEITRLIDQMKEQLEEYKPVPFSNSKIIVEKPEFETFLNDLSESVPEEIKKYQRIVANADKIIADAKNQATEIEERAKAYADKMVQQDEITKLAEANAQKILQQAEEMARNKILEANMEAAGIREGALDYAKGKLEELDAVLSGTIDDFQARYSEAITSLSNHHDVILTNLSELNEVEVPVENELTEDENAALFNLPVED